MTSVETHPALLAVALIVSLLHTIFDMLAFKNDVSFWRKTKSLGRLSVRFIFANGFFQLVIFLYLADNDTNWMILILSDFAFLFLEFSWNIIDI